VPFSLPPYHPPAFDRPPLCESPPAVFRAVERDGIAPEGYHATTIFPEYVHLGQGEWRLIRESRMDCTIALEEDGSLAVKAFRHLKAGDRVVCGRNENGEDGVLVHTTGFGAEEDSEDKFAFRTQASRETSFSIDYDELYELLEHERNEGFIVWVLGPALAFDRDARKAFVDLVQAGYVDALLSGNALAVHDLEGALFGTALGLELYHRQHAPLGHYGHLDAIHRVRTMGSMEQAIREGVIRDGIMKAVIEKQIPYVLAGSIRDDGPLPEVIADAYTAQDRMRDLTRRATTVICMATQLHSIATGNLVPSYTVLGSGAVRPVYFYAVDMSEFVTGKLANRGSLTARAILTNVQDFIVTLERGLSRRPPQCLP
jgi:lysine-ketoglutarate reductase/saccharopine dehydrogenase-like protein (TIGR00300 family)